MFLLEASRIVDEMSKENRRGKLLTILSFVIFSIPMGMIFLFPWLARQTAQQGDFISIAPLLIILNTLIIVSPWAFLSTIIYFYNKQLKLQTYAATLLFSWAALTQVLYMLVYLQYLFPENNHLYSNPFP
jgi:hypothetical protein